MGFDGVFNLVSEEDFLTIYHDEFSCTTLNQV